ncbi:hypothetical protein E4U57_005462 [Claviceps arundinis]|uniref:Uncharacterized protein n=2 Tax=Claviceps arundinis TaxID=1623583 RepID=A0ABQ7P3B2_9HYPO|nr:hypothetical protein E4U57_005462 [Claviceps arundinis]
MMAGALEFGSDILEEGQTVKVEFERVTACFIIPTLIWTSLLKIQNMRKALLTSSEVSALVTICVVVLFTLALFLSGYTLQQRTLQDLRVAIRPGHTRPSPKAHLPGYFKRQTTILDDGTVIVRQSQADVDEQEWLAKKYELRAPKASVESGKANSDTSSSASEQQSNKEKENGRVEGENQTSRPGGDETERKAVVGTSDTRAEATEEQLRILSALTAHAAQQAWGVDHPDPLTKNRLPITKAERRKLIKEEIQKLAQTDRPMYYQRRLW